MLEGIKKFLVDKHSDKLNKKGVNIVSFGNKEIKGKKTNKKSIIFGVDKKVSKSKIAKNDLLPSKLNGFDTDVQEVGEIKVHIDQNRYRPLKGGCQIGTENGQFVGTGGNIYTQYWIYKNNEVVLKTSYLGLSDEILSFFGLTAVKVDFLATNLHVVTISPFDMPIGQIIVQPRIARTDRIGHVIDYFKPDKDFLNRAVVEFDEAIVYLNPNYNTTPLNEIINIGVVKGTKTLKVGDKVKKYGRTTGYTEGIVLSKYSISKVTWTNNEQVIFNGAMIFSGMSDHGDSGSLIVSEDNKAVARLSAGSSSITLGFPINKALKKFKMSV